MANRTSETRRVTRKNDELSITEAEISPCTIHMGTNVIAEENVSCLTEGVNKIRIAQLEHAQGQH
jgi:hypothetical protein